MHDILGLISAHLDLVKAAVLGVVEGLTEFLPVSSTGHLLLMEHFFGWGDDAFGKSFAILIQLGAILALLTIYFGRLWALATSMFTQRAAARFVIGVLLAFLPAAVIGALAASYIKSHLFDVRVVCIMFIVGGFILLGIDRMNLKPRYLEATSFSLPMYFGIGVCQCLAMIPGTSRSGATIIGVLFFGLSRKAATEFTFFLAMPTLIAATLYELYKERALLSSDDLGMWAVGFIASFISAFLCVRWLLRYISSHDFTVFAWYRIAFGLIVLGTYYSGLVSWSTAA